MAASSLGRCCLLAHSRALTRQFATKRPRTWRISSSPPPSSRRWCSQDSFNEPSSGYRYAKTHEYASVGESSGITTIGISNYAQEKLGDVVYVELPEVGTEVEKGDLLGVLESVKAAADVNTPVGGTVAEVNTALTKQPELVNKDSYKEGWLVKMKDVNEENLKDLLPTDEYKKYLEEGVV